MKTGQRLKLAAGGIAVVLCLSAHAGKPKPGDDHDRDHEDKKTEFCFTGFDGTVHYQFSIKGHKSTDGEIGPFQGRVFGALVPCAGLDRWPLMATAVAAGGRIVLTFRAMTVDAVGCGAVDYLAALDAGTLSGPLYLHNARNQFSNTSTLVPAPCVEPPGSRGPGGGTGRGGADLHGNAAF